jgi:hypothetical protein
VKVKWFEEHGAFSLLILKSMVERNAVVPQVGELYNQAGSRGNSQIADEMEGTMGRIRTYDNLTPEQRHHTMM